MYIYIYVFTPGHARACLGIPGCTRAYTVAPASWLPRFCILSNTTHAKGNSSSPPHKPSAANENICKMTSLRLVLRMLFRCTGFFEQAAGKRPMSNVWGSVMFLLSETRPEQEDIRTPALSIKGPHRSAINPSFAPRMRHCTGFSLSPATSSTPCRLAA